MTLVNVTVTDSFSNSVTWLDKENFKVYEDGVQQEISAFSSEDVPISIGLIFDMSGSMATAHGQSARRILSRQIQRPH